jgi:hypothetical protein
MSRWPGVVNMRFKTFVHTKLQVTHSHCGLSRLCCFFCLLYPCRLGLSSTIFSAFRPKCLITVFSFFNELPCDMFLYLCYSQIICNVYTWGRITFESCSMTGQLFLSFFLSCISVMRAPSITTIRFCCERWTPWHRSFIQEITWDTSLNCSHQRAYCSSSWWYVSMELRWNDIERGKQKKNGEKSDTVPLYPPQMPRGLTWARTQASALRSLRLTTWAMARPFKRL